MLLTRGDTAPTTPDPTLVLEGWHNLLVAPEDSAGPGLGAVPWGPLTDPLDFAQYTAPVIAGIAGLWAGLEQTPFDTLEILPGQTVRAVRAFYRRLDTSEVEEHLRTPAVRSGGTPSAAPRRSGARRLRAGRPGGHADHGEGAVDQAPRRAARAAALRG